MKYSFLDGKIIVETNNGYESVKIHMHPKLDKSTLNRIRKLIQEAHNTSNHLIKFEEILMEEK